MKISHIKQDIDGEKSEYLELTINDLRYSHSTIEIQITLEQANLLLAELSEKLSPLPY